MTVKQIGIYFAIGVIVSTVTSCFYDMCLHYNWLSAQVKTGYSYRAMVYELGQTTEKLIYAICFFKLIKSIMFFKLLSRWVIDVYSIDILFLLFSNPYSLNVSKWENIGIATSIFIAQYIYFEHIKKKR